MFVPKAKPTCCVPNCGRVRWALGRCSTCVKLFRAEHPDEAARLANLSVQEQEHEFYMTLHQLPAPHWQWEGDEEALIRICDAASRRNVRVGFFTAGPQPNEEKENV
jgi:hypothetical protein